MNSIDQSGITDPHSGIEQILVEAVSGMRQDFREVTKDVGAIRSDLHHLTEKVDKLDRALLDGNNAIIPTLARVQERVNYLQAEQARMKTFMLGIAGGVVTTAIGVVLTYLVTRK